VYYAGKSVCSAATDDWTPQQTAHTFTAAVMQDWTLSTAYKSTLLLQLTSCLCIADSFSN
jgi:hypothetical protein